MKNDKIETIGIESNTKSLISLKICLYKIFLLQYFENDILIIKKYFPMSVYISSKLDK